ncbi:hypothetical protein D3C72_1238990 [compost metagenome]
MLHYIQLLVNFLQLRQLYIIYPYIAVPGHAGSGGLKEVQFLQVHLILRAEHTVEEGYFTIFGIEKQELERVTGINSGQITILYAAVIAQAVSVKAIFYKAVVFEDDVYITQLIGSHTLCGTVQRLLVQKLLGR